MSKVNIYVSYDRIADQMTIMLPDTKLVADRKTGTLRTEIMTEERTETHERSLGNVMFADMVNLIANKVKGY